MSDTAPPPLVMLDAEELSTRVRRREVSSREVMSAYLDHIERLNPVVNAIVSLQPRNALLAAADRADAEIGRGHHKGWLHGLPHAVKDLALTKGIRTTLGSPLFSDFVPDMDDIFVERLRASGAILIGKTNVPEFGLGSHTYNPVFGPTRNAYDQSKSAGGSSGGAAVALALRMLPVADGSDFGGSLRNPAAWNAVYGFRPSAGRVPAGPSAELFLRQFATDGPMARTVRELALLLSVMAGYDERAPLSLADPPQTFAGPLERDFKGIRIGWLGDLDGTLPMQDGILDLCRDAVLRLKVAGCIVEDATFGVPEQTIWDTWLKLRHWMIAGNSAGLYNDPEKRSKLKPEAAWEIEGGLKLSAFDVYQASVARSSIYNEFRKLFTKFDFLALPSAQVFPFDVELDWPKEIAGKKMDSYHRWMEIVFLGTLSGSPVINVPAGFGGQHKLPMGVQIIGPSRRDFGVLQVAHAYEQIAGPDVNRPPALLVPRAASKS